MALPVLCGLVINESFNYAFSNIFASDRISSGCAQAYPKLFLYNRCSIFCTHWCFFVFAHSKALLTSKLGVPCSKGSQFLTACTRIVLHKRTRPSTPKQASLLLYLLKCRVYLQKLMLYLLKCRVYLQSLAVNFSYSVLLEFFPAYKPGCYSP